MSNRLTAERAREVLEYDPETGVVRWRVARGRVKAGAVAGCKSQGYLDVRVDGEQHRLHRVIFLMVTGRYPEGVDHINGARSDNRWINLREAAQSENLRNCKMHSHNTSGIAGVCWNAAKGKWTARIKVNRKTIHLGHHDKIEDAADARKAAENRLGFSARHGSPVLTDPDDDYRKALARAYAKVGEPA